VASHYQLEQQEISYLEFGVASGQSFLVAEEEFE
jgi:hypothetical protein